MRSLTNVFFVMIKKIGEHNLLHHKTEYYAAVKKNEVEVDFYLQTWKDVYDYTARYKEQNAKQYVQCHPIYV